MVSKPAARSVSSIERTIACARSSASCAIGAKYAIQSEWSSTAPRYICSTAGSVREKSVMLVCVASSTLPASRPTEPRRTSTDRSVFARARSMAARACSGSVDRVRAKCSAATPSALTSRATAPSAANGELTSATWSWAAIASKRADMANPAKTSSTSNGMLTTSISFERKGSLASMSEPLVSPGPPHTGPARAGRVWPPAVVSARTGLVLRHLSRPPTGRRPFGRLAR